jgi:hypothetical protein
LDSVQDEGVGDGSAKSCNGNLEHSFFSRGDNMTHAEENMMDPFNIGVYAIEAGLVGAVIYGMMVLATLLKPMP